MKAPRSGRGPVLRPPKSPETGHRCRRSRGRRDSSAVRGVRRSAGRRREPRRGARGHDRGCRGPRLPCEWGSGRGFRAWRRRRDRGGGRPDAPGRRAIPSLPRYVRRRGRALTLAIQIDTRLLGASPRPGEAGFQLPAATLVLHDGQLAPVHRQRLASLFLPRDGRGSTASRRWTSRDPRPAFAALRASASSSSSCSSALRSLAWRCLSFSSWASSSCHLGICARQERGRASRSSSATSRWPRARPFSLQHVDRDDIGGERSGQTSETRRIDAAEERQNRGRSRPGSPPARRRSIPSPLLPEAGAAGLLFTSITVPPNPASRIRMGSAMRKNFRTLPPALRGSETMVAVRLQGIAGGVKNAEASPAAFGPLSLLHGASRRPRSAWHPMRSP